MPCLVLPQLVFEKEAAFATSLVVLAYSINTTITPYAYHIAREYFGYRGALMMLGSMSLQGIPFALIMTTYNKEDLRRESLKDQGTSNKDGSLENINGGEEKVLESNKDFSDDCLLANEQNKEWAPTINGHDELNSCLSEPTLYEKLDIEPGRYEALYCDLKSPAMKPNDAMKSDLKVKGCNNAETAMTNDEGLCADFGGRCGKYCTAIKQTTSELM